MSTYKAHIVAGVSAALGLVTFASYLIFYNQERAENAPRAMWQVSNYSDTASGYEKLWPEAFAKFIEKHERDYKPGSAEYKYRLEWFSQNFEWI